MCAKRGEWLLTNREWIQWIMWKVLTIVYLLRIVALGWRKAATNCLRGHNKCVFAITLQYMSRLLLVHSYVCEMFTYPCCCVHENVCVRCMPRGENNYSLTGDEYNVLYKMCLLYKYHQFVQICWFGNSWGPLKCLYSYHSLLHNWCLNSPLLLQYEIEVSAGYNALIQLDQVDCDWLNH